VVPRKIDKRIEFVVVELELVVTLVQPVDRVSDWIDGVEHIRIRDVLLDLLEGVTDLSCLWHKYFGASLRDLVETSGEVFLDQ